jgi:hypothetical protein
MKKISCLLIIILIGVAIDADAKKKARKYYLTQEGFTGSQALTACANKFHMASLWEIFDTTALQYDTKNGFTLGDSGSGPPDASGWVRTGQSSNDSSTAGIGNCNAYTSDTGFGTLIALEDDWTNLGNDLSISPWTAAASHCNNHNLVWCVQD